LWCFEQRVWGLNPVVAILNLGQVLSLHSAQVHSFVHVSAWLHTVVDICKNIVVNF